ncbi:MAG TPA: glycosyltransferase family 39 protein [Ilumatobacter sp.]|nr:glycosyltransferase family 39 protein [Ilumatobacter sp.]
MRSVGRRLVTVGQAIDRHRWGPHLAAFALALVLRVAWVLWVDRTGFVLNDTLLYHANAESIAAGDGFRPPWGGVSAQWPPGYSLVLAAVYAVFGVRPQAGELLNAFVGAIGVVLLMMLVERLVNRRTAVVAGIAFAVMPGPIMWTDVLVSETLFTTIFIGLFVVLAHAKPAPIWLVTIGLIIGIGANIRGEAMVWGLLPIVFFWSTSSRPELLRRVALIGAVAIATLIPWTVRNAVVMDAFLPTGTNASHTLWAGHNPAATGGQVYPPAGYDDQFSTESPARELQSSKALRSDAIGYMFSHPLRELELIPLKLIHLNRGDSYIFDWVNAVPAGEAPPVSAINVERIGVLADAAYFALLGFTILGAAVLGRRFWRTPATRCIAASFLTALFLYGFLYYGNYRYRLAYEPLMILVASTFVTRVWSQRERGEPHVPAV